MIKKCTKNLLKITKNDQKLKIIIIKFKKITKNDKKLIKKCTKNF